MYIESFEGHTGESKVYYMRVYKDDEGLEVPALGSFQSVRAYTGIPILGILICMLIHATHIWGLFKAFLFEFQVLMMIAVAWLGVGRNGTFRTTSISCGFKTGLRRRSV